MCSNGNKSILQQASKYQQVLHMTSLSEGQSGDWCIKNKPMHSRWPYFTPLYLIEWQNVYKGLSLIEQLTGSCREKEVAKKKMKLLICLVSYYVLKFKLVKCLCIKYRFRQNRMWQWPCVLCVPVFISPCCPEFTRLQLRKNESHQTLRNATLRLLLCWFASPSWHWFLALGLTGGTSTRRCTSIKVSFSEPPQIFHILKHTGTKRERGTNCHGTLTTPLRPPGQPSLNMSWGQIICHRSTLLFSCCKSMRSRERAHVHVTMSVSDA